HLTCTFERDSDERIQFEKIYVTPVDGAGGAAGPDRYLRAHHRIWSTRNAAHQEERPGHPGGSQAPMKPSKPDLSRGGGAFCS
ncbi:MAG: hypothetical protein PVJ07_06990, partial [Anaerolineales bacterium]